MTTTRHTKETEKDDADAPAKVTDDEPTFTVQRLLSSDGAKITGHPRRVLAGALHGLAFTVELTRAQVKQRIEDFLSRPTTQEAK